MWEEEKMLKVVNTLKAPAAIGPYSQGIILKNILFSSGQIPASPETGEIVGTDITAQAEQVMENVKAILDEAGTSSSCHCEIGRRSFIYL